MSLRNKAGAIVICVVFATGVVGTRGAAIYGDSGDTQARVNREATSAYLTATHTALIEMKRSMRLVTISVSHIVHTTRRHCPLVAADAPRNPSRWPVEVAVTETLLVAASHVDAGITAKLIQKVTSLRWATPKLTRLVRQEALTASARAHHKLPELCSDLREWARDGFQRVPRTLKQFSHEVQPFSEGGGLLNALRKYESTTDRREAEQLGRAVGRELRVDVLSGRKRLFNVVGLRHGNSVVVVPRPSGTVFDHLRRIS